MIPFTPQRRKVEAPTPVRVGPKDNRSKVAAGLGRNVYHTRNEARPGSSSPWRTGACSR